MKKLISSVLVILGTAYAQVLLVTPNGLKLVKDSVSNTPITETLYENFKGDLRYTIRNNNDWMSQNTGKYFLPGIEAGAYLVLQNNGKWGAVQLNGETKVPFEFNDPITFFKNGGCYGVYAKGRSGTFALSGEEASFEGDYQIRDWNGKLIAAYSEMIDDYKGSYLMLGKKPDLCGIINDGLDTVVKFVYSCTSWDTKNFGFSDRGFVALKNPDKKCGVISSKGKTVMPFAYDYIDDLVFPTAIIEKDGKKGLLNNKDLRIKVPIKYDEIQCSSNANMGDYFTAVAKDSSGYDIYDSTFTRIGHYNFEEFGYSFSNPKMVVIKQNGFFGLYDFTKNKYVYSPRYLREDFQCGRNCEEDGKELLYTQDSCYVINQKGKIEYQYAAQDISNLYFNYDKMVLNTGGIQVLKDYQVFLPTEFQDVQYVPNEEKQLLRYLIAMNEEGYGLFDTTGKIIIPFSKDQISWEKPSQDAYYLSLVDSKGFWCMDENLKMINSIPFDAEPEQIYMGVNGNMGNRIVQVNGKMGVFNFKKKEFLVETLYDSYSTVSFDVVNWMTSPGYFYFLLNHRMKCYDENFNLVMDLEGDQLSSTYSKDVLILRKDNVSYLINTKDGKIISEGFEAILLIENSSNFMIVKKKGKYGCINTSGKLVINPKYESFCNKTFWLVDDAMIGFANKENVDYMNYDGKIFQKGKTSGGFHCDY